MCFHCAYFYTDGKNVLVPGTHPCTISCCDMSQTRHSSTSKDDKKWLYSLSLRFKAFFFLYFSVKPAGLFIPCKLLSRGKCCSNPLWETYHCMIWKHSLSLSSHSELWENCMTNWLNETAQQCDIYIEFVMYSILQNLQCRQTQTIILKWTGL